MIDISTIWLKISYSFLTNRNELKKWWVIILVAVTVFAAVFTFTNVILYLIGLPQQNKLMASMAANQLDYTTWQMKAKPQALDVGTPVAVAASVGKYDLMVKVKNSNKNWAVTKITYKFTIADQTTDALTEFIMPNTEQYLTATNVSGPATASTLNLSFSIDSLEWQRIEDPKVLPVADFLVEDVAYSSSAVVNGLSAYRATANITNRGFSGFWRTKFLVVLLNGEREVGIYSASLDSFKAGEKRSLYAQWSMVGGSVTRVAVIPVVNLLESDNVMKN